MPQKQLTIPPLVAAGGGQYTPTTSINPAGSFVGGSPDNFAIGLPSFLAGVVSAAIKSGSDPGCRCVVEIETYPGDWVALFLINPEKAPALPVPMNDSANEGGSQFLEGPYATGWARVSAYRSVRIRRIDQASGVCNAYLNFREGAY